MAQVQDHYAGEGIARRILTVLRAAKGADTPITPDALAPMDHFHGRGALATAELAALLDARPGENILDIGCGIGGPARWIAAKHGCTVTGIDLTPDFCVAARALTVACGLQDKVRVYEASATALPLPDAYFDRAYSHNVVMNIADKAAVYREAFRVLKPGGRLVLLHGNMGPNGPPDYPQPWAAVAEHSFLATDEETRRDLTTAGFTITQYRDTSGGNLDAQIAMRRKVEADGLPAMSIKALMGERFVQLQIATLLAGERRQVKTVEIVAQKPG